MQNSGINQLDEGDGLLVLDVQKDFCPGGRLAVDDGEQVVPIFNRWRGYAREKKSLFMLRGIGTRFAISALRSKTAVGRRIASKLAKGLNFMRISHWAPTLPK